MFKCEFLLIAQQAVVERGTGLVSLINLVDTFGGVSFPFVAPPITIALKTQRDIKSDPQKPEFLLEIKQKEDVLLHDKVGVDFEDKAMNNLVITVNGILIKEPSPIKISYTYGTQKLGEAEMKVNKITPKMEKKE